MFLWYQYGHRVNNGDIVVSHRGEALISVIYGHEYPGNSFSYHITPAFEVTFTNSTPEIPSLVPVGRHFFTKLTYAGDSVMR